jgi:hypothetical protein
MRVTQDQNELESRIVEQNAELARANEVLKRAELKSRMLIDARARLLMAQSITATSVGALRPDLHLKNCTATAGKEFFIPTTWIACLTLSGSRWPPERLTSKKNATAKPMAHIAGFWRVALPCEIPKDASSGGTARTPISRIASRSRKTCAAFLDNFCTPRTKSDAASPAIYTILPVKTSSLWPPRWVNCMSPFLMASEAHANFFLSARN